MRRCGNCRRCAAVLGHELLAESVMARGRAAVLRTFAAIQEARTGLQAGRSLAADPASLAHRSRELLGPADPRSGR